MAVGNANFSTLLSVAIENRNSQVVDSLSNHNALLAVLKEHGGIKAADGGTKIIENIQYADSGAGAQAYSGYDTLNVGSSEFLTAAEFGIKQYASAVQISGLEAAQNSGKAKMLDLVEQKVMAAERALINKLVQDLHGDGSGANTVTGLRAALTTTPLLGTYGNISRVDNSFWRQKVATGTAITTANIFDQYLALYLQLKRGTDSPTVAIADIAHYRKLMNALTANQKFESVSSNKLARAGFTNLVFIDTPVVVETTASGINADTTMFLNCDYLKFRHFTKGSDMINSWSITPANQDAEITRMKIYGNLTISNLAAQGIITG